MGSSAKKKDEKKKDFKKPKFKVGKARPKPTNFTDTSFKSKAIVLTHQVALSTSAPSTSSQFSHHISLLSSRSFSQRRDSLAYLKSTVTARPDDTSLPPSVSLLLPKLYPLILDESNEVRAQLLLLFKNFPSHEVEPEVEKLLVHIRAGLTHLAVDIRLFAADLLCWVIELCPMEVVSCPGGWCKTIKTLLTALHWPEPAISNVDSKWTSLRGPTLESSVSQSKLPVKLLNALTATLRAGLIDPPKVENSTPSKWPFPLCNVEAHMIPKKSNPYRRLNLFGPPRDEDGEMYEDRRDRQDILGQKFKAWIDGGVQGVKKQEGEIGRAAAEMETVLSEGMKGYQSQEW